MCFFSLNCRICFELVFPDQCSCCCSKFVLKVDIVLGLIISKFDNFIFSLIDHSAKMTKKKPKFGALPKLNMPKKSHETSKPSPRPERSVVNCNEETLPHSYYKGFSELCQRVKSLKSLGDWSVKIFDDKIVLKKMVDDNMQLVGHCSYF